MGATVGSTVGSTPGAPDVGRAIDAGGVDAGGVDRSTDAGGSTGAEADPSDDAATVTAGEAGAVEPAAVDAGGVGVGVAPGAVGVGLGEVGLGEGRGEVVGEPVGDGPRGDGDAVGAALELWVWPGDEDGRGVAAPLGTRVASGDGTPVGAADDTGTPALVVAPGAGAVPAVPVEGEPDGDGRAECVAAGSGSNPPGLRGCPMRLNPSRTT